MIVKKRNSISTKLVLGFSLSLTILIVFLTAVICVRLKNESISDFSREWSSTLSHTGNTISTFFDGARNTVSMITNEDIIRAADESLYSFTDKQGEIKTTSTPKSELDQSITKFFTNIFNSNSTFMEVYMGTVWGGYSTSFDGFMSGGYDPRLRAWYQQAMNAQGNSIITPAYLSITGDVVVGLCKSVYNKDSVFIGNVGIDISLNTITRIIDRSKVGKTGFMMAIQQDNVVLADAKNAGTISKTLDEIGIPDLLQIKDMSSGTITVNMDDKNWLAQIHTVDGLGWKLVAFMEEAEVLEDFTYAARTMIGLGAILLVLFAVGTALFAVSLLRPVGSIMQTIDKISNGDFSSHLHIKTKDEFYVMGEKFNIAIDNIKAAMISVQGSTVQVLSAGDALVSNMGETASSIQEIHNNLDEVKQQTETQAASVTETTATMEQIISSIGNLNASIEKQATRLASSSNSIQKMIGSVDTISEILHQNELLINTLFERTAKGKEKVLEAGKVTAKIEEESENLLEASKVIQNVATNTNLLAMNAAIEAAHVGENGKGFAVVAGEIRKLAQDSDSQGKKIATVIQESLDIIKDLGSVRKEEEALFTEIYRMAKNVLEKQKLIIGSINELSSGNREVLSGINELSTVTEHVKCGSSEMLQGSETVSYEMGRLNSLTSEISNKMASVASSVVQINGAVKEVENISKECTNSMTELSVKIKKFKVE